MLKSGRVRSTIDRFKDVEEGQRQNGYDLFSISMIDYSREWKFLSENSTPLGS